MPPKGKRTPNKSRRNNMPRRPRAKTNKGRNANDRLTFAPSLGQHLPMPAIYYTRFTASGSFYTGSGAATGDYNWSFNLNSIAKPFSSVTTGVTWNNLTPSTYECPGATSLLSATMYSTWVVYSAIFEIDVTPQSVTDSVVVTVTPSQTAGIPASVGVAAGRPFTRQATFASGRTYKQRDFPLFQRFSAWKLLGIPKYLYTNDTSGNFVGGVSSGVPTNPPVNLPWVVNCETGDNAVLGFPLEVRVRVTYFVKLYGLESAALALVVEKPPRRQKQIVPGVGAVYDSVSPKNWHYPRVQRTVEQTGGDLDSLMEDHAYFLNQEAKDPVQGQKRSTTSQPAVRATKQPATTLPTPDMSALEHDMSLLLDSPKENLVHIVLPKEANTCYRS